MMTDLDNATWYKSGKYLLIELISINLMVYSIEILRQNEMSHLSEATTCDLATLYYAWFYI